MAWKTIARSAQGKHHQQHHLPCQDYGQCRVLADDLVVGAIADGAGSATQADIGAQLAVETALEILKETLIGPMGLVTTAPDNKEVSRLFERLAQTVLERLTTKAQQKGYLVGELACTLLAFFATSQWMAAMQIGDGFIVTSNQRGAYQLIFKPHKGVFANHTTFVTSPNVLENMKTTVLLQPQKFICLSTDGLEKVALKLKAWTPFSPFFEPLRDYLEEVKTPEIEDDYITTFLDSDALNARVTDDKTLLLCLHY